MTNIENTFTLENVENEIIKRLGESTAQTMIDEDNEDRVIPLFWQSVTDIIISGEYQEEDVAGLIEERKAKIKDDGDDNDIGKIDLSSINIDIEDDDAWDDYDKTMLRYHDIYSVPGASAYLNKIIQEKSLKFIKQILGGDPRQAGEVYVYKVGNELKFFKDDADDVIGKYVNVVYIKSPNPLESTGGGSLLTTYSLGFIYKAIDLTVNKIKEERQ